MLIILKSLPLSIFVTLRMIMPILLIFIASTVINLILAPFTLGLSSLLITPTTTTFIALYGMYVALELTGKRGLIDWRLMISYSLAFGIILELIKLAGLFAIQYLSFFAAQQSLGLNVSLRSLQAADETLQGAFVISTISFLAMFSLAFLSALQAAFAVPMAAAANSSFVKSHGRSIGTVFNKSFLPLFIIAAISLFLQFFFKIFAVFTFFFGTIVFQIALLIEVAAERISDEGLTGLVELFTFIDPAATLLSIASILAVLWLKSWIWSAAVLAFIHHDKVATEHTRTENQVPPIPSQDLRALRKARENHRH